VTDGKGADRAAELAPEPVVGGRNSHHLAAHSGGLFGLALGALGIVFGDIGTSPLYAVQTVFSIDNHAVGPTSGDVYGVVSLIFWSVTLIVTVKYVSFILWADNDGEGGVMALAALVRGVSGSSARLASIALALGVLGASLFYGDSLITPAISVLSAVEGLKVARPELAQGGAADRDRHLGAAVRGAALGNPPGRAAVRTGDSRNGVALGGGSRLPSQGVVTVDSPGDGARPNHRGGFPRRGCVVHVGGEVGLDDLAGYFAEQCVVVADIAAQPVERCVHAQVPATRSTNTNPGGRRPAAVTPAALQRLPRLPWWT
jgi:hypothetical protein